VCSSDLEESFYLTFYYLSPQEVARNVEHSAEFQSIAREFEIATSSPTRYNELVPEFHLMPELFSVDVELPPWAHNSAVDCVYLLRKALESDTVSAKLHSWIDLIWGFKQQGSEADLTFNTFVPSLYNGAKPEPEVLRVSGIVPHQLFQAPHPRRTKGLRGKDLLTGIRVLEISDVPIIFAKIFYETYLTYRVCFVNNAGEFVYVTFKYAGGPSGPKRAGSIPELVRAVSLDCVTETSRVPLEQFGDFSRPLLPSHFALSRSGLALVDGTKPSVSFVDPETGNRLDVNCHYGEANCVSDSNEWVVTQW
jgi:hypothetical protein